MIWKLFLFCLFAVLTACSDESPFEAMEEDLQDAEACANSMAYAASHSSSSMSIYDQCLYNYSENYDFRNSWMLRNTLQPGSLLIPICCFPKQNKA